MESVGSTHRDLKPWHNFRLVSGYLPEIDQLPEIAVKLRLKRRIALVLNDDESPCSELYWDLIEAIIESLRSDSVVFELDTEIDKEPLLFSSVALMRSYVQPRPELRPFHRATFYLRGTPRAFVNTEPYAVSLSRFLDIRDLP